MLCVLLLPKQVFDLRLDLKIHFSNFNVTLNAHSKATNSNIIHFFRKNKALKVRLPATYILKKKKQFRMLGLTVTKIANVIFQIAYCFKKNISYLVLYLLHK